MPTKTKSRRASKVKSGGEKKKSSKNDALCTASIISESISRSLSHIKGITDNLPAEGALLAAGSAEEMGAPSLLRWTRLPAMSTAKLDAMSKHKPQNQDGSDPSRSRAQSAQITHRAVQCSRTRSRISIDAVLPRLRSRRKSVDAVLPSLDRTTDIAKTATDGRSHSAVHRKPKWKLSATARKQLHKALTAFDADRDKHLNVGEFTTARRVMHGTKGPYFLTGESQKIMRENKTRKLSYEQAMVAIVAELTALNDRKSANDAIWNLVTAAENMTVKVLLTPIQPTFVAPSA